MSSLAGRRPSGGRLPGGRLTGIPGIALAVALRPRLWPIGMTVVLQLARPGWWRQWPPTPYPDRGYWRFRMVTAYGGKGDDPPRPGDVVAYLEWCRERRVRRPRCWRPPGSALR